MRAKQKWLIAAVLFAVPFLNGCSSSDFDPTDLTDKLDIFNLNEQKKLKGERKPLFPEGVPGVSQGIPQELVKGNKPPETAAVVEQPPPEEKPKPKPKPRVVNRAPPKPAPTRVQVAPAQPAPAAQPQQAQRQQSAWPEPQQQKQQQQTGAQSPWPSSQPQQQTSPWPDAPPPNTFQR